MEEHALLWHGQETGGDQSNGSEDQGEHQDVFVGHQVEADDQLTQNGAHSIAQELHAAAVGRGLPVPLQIYHTATDQTLLQCEPTHLDICLSFASHDL